MALWNAFNRNSLKITGAITRETIKELAREKPDKPYRRPKKALGLAIISAVLVPLIIVLLYFAKGQSPETTVIDESVNKIDVLASSGPSDSALDKQKIPEKPLVINQSEPGENISEDMDVHSVHVGAFETASQANWRLKNLKSLGFPSFMYTRINKNGNTVYEVVAGKYQSYDLAEEASRSLSKKGHFNFIATAKDSINEGPQDDQIH
jgi:hypothetical protein